MRIKSNIVVTGDNLLLLQLYEIVIMIKMHFYAKINPRPQLTIKGRWLEQIGFYVGCPVIIKIEQGKLVVELAMQI